MNARHATAAGEALLSLEHVSLSFGGVNAISDVSFDIRKGEIRAIIGPNGAGKTSMLNVINGFYQPQIGRILFRGEARSRMRPYEAASQGIARTFQNVALFKGMTTLDNIMTGRNLRMKKNLFWQALRHGPALEEEIAHRRVCRGGSSIFLEIEHIRKTAGPALSPYGLQERVELGRAARDGAGVLAAARRADGRDESRGKGRHEPLRHRGEPASAARRSR